MSLTIFTATWCGPCKQIKTWLESNGYLDKVHFVDIDSPDGTIPLGVKSVPTLIDTEHEKIVSGVISIINHLKYEVKWYSTDGYYNGEMKND